MFLNQKQFTTLSVLILAAIGLSSCTPAFQMLPATAYPTWPSSTPYYSAPRDQALDTACRIAINLYFSYRQGDDPQAYRNLFTSKAQFRADGFTPPAHSRIILELMPASEEWLRDLPGTPIPPFAYGEGPNAYVYWVRFTGIDEQPSATSGYSPPDFMRITMIADGPNSCKITNLGKG